MLIVLRGRKSVCMMRFKLPLYNADNPEQRRDASEVRRFCKLFENS
jgi:hypothetical protein